MTFQALTRHVTNGTFKKPNFQGTLNDDKVNGMMECYVKTPSNFQYKNMIVIGIINGKFYIIDGQHRVEMIIELCENFTGYNRKNIIITYYPLKSINEALQLFKEINMDSHKNQFFITQNLFGQMTISNMRDKLKENLKNLFSTKQQSTSRIKCIEEFSEELFKCNFLQDKTSDEAYSELMNLNDIYFNKLYKKYMDDGLLYRFIYKDEEKSLIDNSICFITKNNNFIEYIKNKTIKPKHNWKKGKKRITKGLKKKVWYNYYGDKSTGICPIKHCKTILTNTHFEAGHIISEMNGGPTDLSNLRPICKQCNLEMGSTNWSEFDNCN